MLSAIHTIFSKITYLVTEFLTTLSNGVSSGVTRGLRQGMQNLAEEGSLANTLKKKLRNNSGSEYRGSIPAKKMKTPQKTQKNNNLQKIKRILNTEMSAKGGPVFTVKLPVGAARPLAPCQLRHWVLVNKYNVNIRNKHDSPVHCELVIAIHQK